MLTQFALLTFALFGIAALAIDLGYVRLTQIQMQSAADSAALEGLRYRNTSSDGFEADCIRRIAARDMVTRSFTDPATAVAAGSLTAPPTVSVLDTVGRADAFGRTQVQALPYQPIWLNQATNVLAGDMVSGVFAYDSQLVASDEDDAYVRNDFVVPAGQHAPQPGLSSLPDGCPTPDDPENPWQDAYAWPADAPASGEGPLGFGDNPPDHQPNDSAFLLRLRRTTNSSNVDDVSRVSSTGAPIPLLFGRGGTIPGSEAAGPGGLRHDGFTVRATAIAGTRPALRIGPPTDTPEGPIAGATPFALSIELFASLPTAGAPDPTYTCHPDYPRIGADGTIRDAATGTVVGGQFTPALLTTVGQAVAAPAPVDFAADPNGTRGFVPIYETIAGVTRIVGFGRVTFWPPCTTPDDNVLRFQLARGSQHVVEINASAHLSDGLPADVSPDDVPQLMLRNRCLGDESPTECAPSLPDPRLSLLVPVLVR